MDKKSTEAAMSEGSFLSSSSPFDDYPCSETALFSDFEKSSKKKAKKEDEVFKNHPTKTNGKNGSPKRVDSPPSWTNIDLRDPLDVPPWEHNGQPTPNGHPSKTQGFPLLKTLVTRYSGDITSLFINSLMEKGSEGGGKRVDLNQTVDKLMSQAREDPDIMQMMEPLSLPVMGNHDFSLRNVQITGLMKGLSRYGDCYLKYLPGEIEVPALDVHLAAQRIHLTADYVSVATGIHGKIAGKIRTLAFRSLLAFTSPPRLVSIYVTNISGLRTTEVTGATFFLNWALRLMSNLLLSSQRRNISQLLENTLLPVINNMLVSYQIPI